MTYVPPQYGGESDSGDYEPLIEGDSIIDDPISLVSHSVTGVTPETIDALFQNYAVKEKGRIVRKRKTIRPAEMIGGSMTINIGNAPWSPVTQYARRKGTCPKTFYGVRLCPDDADKQLAYIYTEVRFNPPSRPNDFITVNEFVLAEWQVEATFEEELLAWYISMYEQAVLAEPMYAVAFLSESCVGCETGQPYTDMVAGGGEGTGTVPPTAYTTDDRWANNDSVPLAGPDDHVVTSVYSNGDVVLFGFADKPLVSDATSTTGGVEYSDDRGVTTTLDTNITEPVRGVGEFNGRYFAVGGTDTGDGLIWTSQNGVDWTSLSTGALATGKALGAFAADPDRQRFYVVGQGGVCLMGKPAGSSFALSAISLPNVATTNLFSVAVLGPGHIAVGGASGYYAESLDGGETWEQPEVPGTSTIRAIAGKKHRCAVAAGTNVYIRDIISKNKFVAAEVRDGATTGGNVTALAVSEDMNYFAYATDTGEVGMLIPPHPNA